MNKDFGVWRKIYCNNRSIFAFLCLMILSVVIQATAFSVSHICTPCWENYYCQGGINHECPDDRPVTEAGGTRSEAGCMTCFDKNSATPAFDGEECITCYEYDPTTPYWNGTSCSMCPTNSEWDTNQSKCISECAFVIPHGDETLCLKESVDYTAFEDISPRSAGEETTEFKEKYGIVNSSAYYPDYWAGAMKYCQDKGLRLPTPDELVSIMNAVYNASNTCLVECQVANSTYIGTQIGCCDYTGLTASNTELWNYLKSGSKSTANATGGFYLWSSAEYSSKYAYRRYFDPWNSASQDYTNNRSNTAMRVACIKGSGSEESKAPTCDTNATETDGSCVCNASYYGDGTTCTQCPSNSTSTSGATDFAGCICSNGYYMNNNSCVICPIGSYCNGGTIKECPSSTPMTTSTGATSSSACVTCATVNSNTPHWDGSSCVACQDGTHWDGSSCVACQDGTHWDGSSCVTCPTGTQWDGASCEAISGDCPSGTVADANGVCTLINPINSCESGYIAISTAEQLAKIGVDANYPLSGSYCMMNDIDLSAYDESVVYPAVDYTSYGWIPIGNDNDFTGVFDGNNHKITNLYIDNAEYTDDYNYDGLFGTLVDATVRNLHVSGYIKSVCKVGGLAGEASGDLIVENTSFTGTIKANCEVGGLIGSTDSGVIKNSFTDVRMSSSFNMYSYNIGGLIGNNYAHVKNSYSKGSINNPTEISIGGLVGFNEGVIESSYSSVDIVEGSYVGGLVGDNRADIFNSYSTGSVNGNIAGAFVGSAGGAARIDNCYSIGLSNGYGFLGEDVSTHNEGGGYYDGRTQAVLNSYFDTTTSGTSIGSPNGLGITGKTTAEMQVLKGTNGMYSDWDESIWTFSTTDYPKLTGLGGSADCDANATEADGSCSCNAGYYGDGTTCTQCPNNSASTSGATDFADCICADGYYMNGNSCAVCPMGSYCTGGRIEECPSSAPMTASTGATSSSACKTCAEINSSTPVWNDEEGSCKACQNNSTWNGSYCACDAGYYGTNTTCYDCTAGNYCPGDTQNPIVCEVGNYCPNDNMTTPTDCGAGYYCPNTGMITRNDCTAGNYCPGANDTNQTPCPVGSYCPNDNMTTPTDCGAGYYCPNIGMDTRYDCTAGNYCPGPNDTAQTTCPAGSYCPNDNMTTPTACGAGYYCPNTSMTTRNDCTAGNYCPGANDTNQTPCPAGSYCPTTNLTIALNCGAGYYCPNTGMTTRNICQAGYYCPGTNNTTQTGCPAGSYCPNTGMTSTIICPANNYCPSYSITFISCPSGKTSPAGSSSESDCVAGCGPGYYKTPDSCEICPEGWYCSGTSELKHCPVNSYCPAGSSSPIECPYDGYTAPPGSFSLNGCKAYSYDGCGFHSSYSEAEGSCVCHHGYYSETGTNCALCPKNAMCQMNNYWACDGQLVTFGEGYGYFDQCHCPKGTYSIFPDEDNDPSNDDDYAACKACPAGYYCPEREWVYQDPPLPCPDGTTSPEGSGRLEDCV